MRADGPISGTLNMEDQRGANPKQKAHLGVRAPTAPGKTAIGWFLVIRGQGYLRACELFYVRTMASRLSNDRPYLRLDERRAVGER